MVDKEPVLYQEHNGIARITLNRPEVLNAMNADLLQQVASLVDKAKGG